MKKPLLIAPVICLLSSLGAYAAPHMVPLFAQSSSPNLVPEPTIGLGLLAGLIGLFFWMRRR